jgi:DNA polymerase-3 subunit delta'
MIALPESLADAPAVLALNRALDAGRLPHGILLAGEDLESLRSVALALSSRILGTPTPESHADFHELRPANKMRRIGMEDTQDLVREIRISSFAGRKIGLVIEADRMASESSNAFLKTLEEPPAGTTLILLTTKPNAILDTIRSRCLLFKVPANPATEDAALMAIEGWLDIFSKWHRDLRLAPGERPEGMRVSHWFLGVYGLVATFETTLDNIADIAWKKLKASLPETMEDEQIIGLETGVQKGLRTRFFTGVIERLRLASRQNPSDDASRRLATGIVVVERYAGLLEVNLNDAAAMESLLLQLLRIETARE